MKCVFQVTLTDWTAHVLFVQMTQTHYFTLDDIGSILFLPISVQIYAHFHILDSQRPKTVKSLCSSYQAAKNRKQLQLQLQTWQRESIYSYY